MPETRFTSLAEMQTVGEIAKRHIEGWPFLGVMRADIERALLEALRTEPPPKVVMPEKPMTGCKT